MSELFGNFKRPRAEKKLIEIFIKKYEKAKELFKSKSFIESLDEYNSAYELLADIWDVFPKIVTLYSMMKGYFYTKQYPDCKNIISVLEPLLIYIPKNKFDLFIKMKSKIMILRLILYFIYNDLDASFDSVIEMIKYLTNNDDKFNLEEKVKFFWNYIKGFLKITGITKGNKFRILKEGFDTMIVEQIILNNDEENNNKEEKAPPDKKINRNMIEIYKNYMNSKLRGIVYEVLDKEFFFVKYHKKNDKVMMFLHKNMNIFVRDNNKEKLMELFYTFIILNRMNLKIEYNMSLNQLVQEQKRRIETFDKIFNNLVGSFNHIFKNDFAMPLVNITKNIKKNISKKNSFKFNINELKNMIKVKINSPLRWRKKKHGEKDEDDKEKEKENDKPVIPNRKISMDYGFINEIKIPPNTEEMDKQILLDNYMTKKGFLNNLSNKNSRKNIISNYKTMNLRTISNNKRMNKNPLPLKLPTITIPNGIDSNEEEKNFVKNIHKKKHILKLNKKIKTEKKDEPENITDSIQKKNKYIFKLRNINNYLITKILNIFTSVYFREHNIETEEILEKVHITKKDLFDFGHNNCISSYYAISSKGNQLDNQDNYFYYNNYFLIKNLSFFGVLDGHGKNGKEVSRYISTLLPSYLFYLILDENLSERKLEINKEIIKLIKLQEPPQNIKNMFILTYFFNKFEVDFTTTPFLSYTPSKFFNLILESIYYSQNALKFKYDLDISNSGTTLCSIFILGNILYLINIGDSRAIMGTYYSRINKWKTYQLSIDHKPNNPIENRRIISFNGRIERLKNEFGEEYGPYRIFGRDNDSSGPGLMMSRSIGDLEAKKYGVIYDPEIFRFELKENDKVIVIGTDGLWDQLKNEEVIEIIGECLNKDLKAKETAEILVERARKKYINKNKKDNFNKNKKGRRFSVEENNYTHAHNYEEKNENKNSNIINMHIDDITCIVIYLDIKK